MEAIEDTSKLIQDMIVPELREVGAKLQALADVQKAMWEDMLSGQKALRDDMLHGQKAFTESLKDTEVHMLREIVKSEERILLLLKVADLSNQNAELTKRLEEKKTAPAPAQPPAQ